MCHFVTPSPKGRLKNIANGFTKNAMKLHFTKSFTRFFSKNRRLWDRVPRSSINLNLSSVYSHGFVFISDFPD